MNDPDLFARAARALHDVHDGQGAPGARARLLARATAARTTRRRRLLTAGPLAAALLVSTAWAAASGRLARWVEDAMTSVRGDGAPAASPVATPLPELPPAVLDAPPAPTSLENAAPAPVVDDAGAPPAVSSTHAARVPAPPPPSARPSVRGADDDEALYLAAHRAHFTTRDPAAALAAWDAYLRAYPRGRFALEAAYDRAIDLVRLHRIQDARQALAPFASGMRGGYRQKEARTLIDALESDGG